MQCFFSILIKCEIGMVVYSSWLKDISFKKILVCNSCLCITVSLSQIVLVTRANTAIGVPDEIFAVFCTFIVQLTTELSMIPLLVLCCKICPNNIEGSLYALLMSVRRTSDDLFRNFSNTFF
jgi:hypothetical protein